MRHGLRSLLRRDPGSQPSPAPELPRVEPIDAPEVAITPGSVTADAYGATGSMTFRIESGGERLVDILNQPEATPTLLEGGGDVDLDDVLVVVAGPRVSDPSLRLHRPGHAIDIRIGPWRVEGNAHGPPAADVIGYWMRYRPHFVVITEARLSLAGQPGYAQHPALLVNIRMAESATLRPQGAGDGAESAQTTDTGTDR
jgi:hypothetical protein